LSEANITIFAKTTSNRALKYCLDNYLGLVKKQIDRAKKLNSRARRIIRGYPMIFWLKSKRPAVDPPLHGGGVVGGWSGGFNRFFGIFFGIQLSNKTLDARFYGAQRTKRQILTFFKGV